MAGVAGESHKPSPARGSWRWWALGLAAAAALVAAAVGWMVVGGDGDGAPTTTASDDAGGSARASEAQPAGSWSDGGRWAVDRDDDAAAVGLAGGRVLVVGGSVARSAEVWDRRSRRSEVVGELADPRGEGHSATRLADGRVLVAGGRGGLASAELYDPDGEAWQPAAALHTGRSGHTATRLADGRVLVAGGVDVDGVPLASAEVYDPDADVWAEAGRLAEPRGEGHTATRLADGGVVVAGGADGVGVAVEGVARFDPDTDRWQQLDPLATARTAHAAVALTDGRLLAVGGADTDGQPLASAEAYDPDAGAWSAVEPMDKPRAALSATRLADDTVLVVAGQTAERYAPAVDGWWEAASPQQFHSRHAAVALDNGDVVMAASKGSGGSAEVYRPETVPVPQITDVSPAQGSTAGGWPVTVQGAHLAEVAFVEVGAQRVREVTAASPDRLRLSAPAQPAGTAPVSVTTPGGTSDPVELAFAADDGEWRPAGELTEPLTRAGTARWDGPACDGASPPGWCGQLLMVGGAAADRYDPDGGGVTATAALPEAVAGPDPATRLHAAGRTSRLGGPECGEPPRPDHCGDVLALGRSGSQAAVYDPDADRWRACGQPGGPACPPAGEAPDSDFDYRWHRTVTLDGPACREPTAADHCGAVVAFRTLPGRPPQAWRVEPATGEWTQLASPTERREMFAATLVDGQACNSDDPPEACGQILIAGGTAFEPGRGVRAETAELYDPAADQWRATTQAPQPGRARPAAAALPDGRVLLAGGYLDPAASDTVEVFDPDGETWQPLPSLPQPRQAHAAVALADGRVLIAGGVTTTPAGDRNPAGSALVGTPDTGEWTYTASLARPRRGGGSGAPYHLLASAALPDGTAVVVGGRGDDGALATVERYHPAGD